MLRAVSHDAFGRPTLVIGLTDENWRRLLSNQIKFDANDLGLDATIVIFRGRDIRDLKGKAVELGLADRSLLDMPEASPIQSQRWEPNGPKES